MVRNVVDLIRGRWVLAILVCLEPGPRNYMDLLRAVNKMTPEDAQRLSERVLSDTLRRLEQVGLVVHRPVDGCAVAPYELEVRARSLLGLLEPLEEWARDHRDGLPSPDAALGHDAGLR